MNDVAIVRMGQSRGDLYPVAEYGLDRQPHRANERVQRLAIDQLHHDVQFAAEFADFVDRADIGVVQRGGRAGLVQQKIPCGGVPDDLGAEQLEGDVAVQEFIASAIDDAMPPSPIFDWIR
jgi:hypothetical protein